MGGRGHGRGNSMLFTAEQLGVGRGEVVPAVAAPLPDYPPLEHRPAPLPVGRSVDDAALRHRVGLTTAMAGLRLALAPSANEPLEPLSYDWTYFPLELRPTKRRARLSSAASISVSHKPSKIARKNFINELLEELEQKETVEVKKEPVEETKEGEEEDDEHGGGQAADEDEEDVDMDDEMDEGTDYNMNYFDNGENYLDEDDDADDGPIY